MAAIKGGVDNDEEMTAATVATRNDSCEGEPTSPVAAQRGVAPIMEVNTAVQQEEISLQGLQGKKSEAHC
jgi:hypothetical protein